MDQKKTDRLFIRLTSQEKRDFGVLAALAGLNMTSYLKTLLYDDMQKQEQKPEFLDEYQRQLEKIKVKSLLHQQTMTAYFFLNKIERLRDIYAKSVVYGIAFPVELMKKWVNLSLIEFNLLSSFDRELLKDQEQHFRKFLEAEAIHKLMEFKIADHLRLVRGKTLC